MAEAAGFEYPVEEVSWLKREVLLFANSIGVGTGEGLAKGDGANDELHYLYVGHSFLRFWFGGLLLVFLFWLLFHLRG